tara:strand:- start:110 stop:394 length:285 start_codon:yes stop_codon:yes gene_type:complete
LGLRLLRYDILPMGAEMCKPLEYKDKIKWGWGDEITETPENERFCPFLMAGLTLIQPAWIASFGPWKAFPLPPWIACFGYSLPYSWVCPSYLSF